MKTILLSFAVFAAVGGTILISQSEIHMATFYYSVGCFLLLLRNVWSESK